MNILYPILEEKSMEIISKKDAKNKELKRYFTGKSCKNGHIAERMVTNGDCVECKRLATKRNYEKNKANRAAYYQRNREKLIKKQQERDAKRKDEIKAYQQQYREEHREENKAYQKEYYADNSTELKQKSREHYNENLEYYKNYAKQYYEANKEKLLEYAREYYPSYYAQNREQIKEKTKLWYHSQDEEYIKGMRKSYRESDEGRVINNALGAKRRAQKMCATPLWCETDEIRNVYAEARQKTLDSGTPYHVDHVVPLVSDKVCGLHCLANLDVIPAQENQEKGNKLLQC